MADRMQRRMRQRRSWPGLRAAGHQAYFVGGCVRDLLLGRAAEDFDVATSAPPDQVLTPV